MPEATDWRAGEDSNKEDAEAPGDTEGAYDPKEARDCSADQDAMIEDQDRNADGGQGDCVEELVGIYILYTVSARSML